MIIIFAGSSDSYVGPFYPAGSGLFFPARIGLFCPALIGPFNPALTPAGGLPHAKEVTSYYLNKMAPAITC